MTCRCLSDARWHYLLIFFKLCCQVQAPKHLQTRCVPRLSIEYLRRKRKKKGQHRFFFLHCSSNVRTKSRGFRQFYIWTAESFFCVYIFSSKHEGKLGEFKKVMQTLDTIKSLHSFRKYPKKLLPIHVTCLFSVTNLSKI